MYEAVILLNEMAHERVLDNLNLHLREIPKREATIKDKIQATFGRLHKILDLRETELITELSALTQKKLKCLEAQKKHIESNLAQLKFGPDSATVKQVNELLDVVVPEFNIEADPVFSVAEDMHKACLNYGQLLIPDSSNKKDADNPTLFHTDPDFDSIPLTVTSKWLAIDLAGTLLTWQPSFNTPVRPV